MFVWFQWSRKTPLITFKLWKRNGNGFKFKRNADFTESSHACRCVLLRNAKSSWHSNMFKSISMRNGILSKKYLRALLVGNTSYSQNKTSL